MEISTKTLLDDLIDKISKASNPKVYNSEELDKNYIETLTDENENNTTLTVNIDNESKEVETKKPKMWIYNSTERKISPKDLWILSKHLKDFLDYLTGLTEILSSTYRYPIKLKQQIVKDTTNLSSLQREIQASVDEVTRLKRDRKAIKKEKRENLKILEKLKKTESEELEKIVKCNSAVFGKWSEIKNYFREERAREILQEIKKERNALDALEVLISGEMKKQGIITEESYESINKEFWLNPKVSKCRKNNIWQQPSDKKLFKKVFQIDNDSIETYEEADEGSIDTTSDIPGSNATGMSTNSSSDLIQLNPTTMTFNNNFEDRIQLPAIDHPCARERLASRNNELEQRFTGNQQRNGTELILESIYTMESTD